MVRDFPLNEIATSNEIELVHQCFLTIFEKLKKNSRTIAYPITRYLRLLEAIGRDIFDKLLNILQRKRPMYMDYVEFDQVSTQMREIFSSWQEQFGAFR